MIKFVQKQNSFPIPENERFIKPPKFKIPEEWEKFQKVLKIEEASSYKRDLKSREQPSGVWDDWRRKLKVVRKEVTQGFIYDDKIPETTKTHYYPSESNLKTRLYTSKFIGPSDRLMYDIYAPILVEDVNAPEGYVVLQRIVLLFCAGHTHRNGKKFSQD